MSQTKIIATVGPNILEPKALEILIRSGVSVFRLNLKHNTVEWHTGAIEMINHISKKMSLPIATLIDLQGPSLRVILDGDSIFVKENEVIECGDHIFSTKQKGLSFTHPEAILSLVDGQKIFLDEGRFEFEVEIRGNKKYLISHSQGEIKNKKSCNVPGFDFDFPLLVKKDIEALTEAARLEVDFIALSFVRQQQDVIDLRNQMSRLGLSAKVISKIETRQGLDAIDSIIDESDGIMIARGDLGVELSFEKVPYFQKMIISKCLEKAKFVITATHMLNSMIVDPSPTRAEVSDVANAVYDLTDAVMLSGETAYGKYPFESVDVMNTICSYNEQLMTYDIRKRYHLKTPDDESRVTEMAYNLFLSIMKDNPDSFGGFIVFTETGRTARLLSRYRPRPYAPIYAFVPSKKVRDELMISFGVTPIIYQDVVENADIVKSDIEKVRDYLLSINVMRVNQKVIVLHGDVWSIRGRTSTVKLLEV